MICDKTLQLVSRVEDDRLANIFLSYTFKKKDEPVEVCRILESGDIHRVCSLFEVDKDSVREL